MEVLMSNAESEIIGLGNDLVYLLRITLLPLPFVLRLDIGVKFSVSGRTVHLLLTLCNHSIRDLR